MDRKPRIIAVLAVATLILMAGCLGGLTGEDRTDEEIQQDSLAAMEDVESYSFDMSLSMDADSEMMPMDMEVNASGQVDVANEQLAMTMSMPMFGEMEMYVVDGTMYSLDPFSGWTTEPVEGDFFDEVGTTTIADQRELLEAADVEHAGTEEINDRTVNVLSVDVSEEAIGSLLDEEMGGESGDVGAGTDVPGDSYETFDITFYTGQDDDLLYRMTLEATISGDSAMAGTESMSVEMTMDFDDYNEDVDIEVPAEATG